MIEAIYKLAKTDLHAMIALRPTRQPPSRHEKDIDPNR
jgi:hypothetical protein